ncbi:MAG: aldo/keto reductase [Actinobacteria bacterium 13_2_20CM_2_71_6]|nr:MAG: aldo/keto reductase [Actinobacteria bacterium 13_2_20CM_2_71_6]
MKTLGRSGVGVTELGFGAASLGNLYRAISDGEAAAAVSAAWDRGVRYFDTAPHYGLGLSERRMGTVLRDHPRAEFTLSTKVGRLLVPNPGGENQRDLDNGFDVPAGLRRHWDFSADGIRRSLAESMERLGLDRIDIVLMHDPEESDQPETALTEGYAALHELRAQGVIGAVGVGSKQVEILRRFVTETELDTIMLAGRYTLLEQPALDELLPACEKHGVSVLNVGVFNSGLLAKDWPEDDGHYEYGSAPPKLVERARQIASLCRRYGTSLPHAALVFAGAHPTVASVVVGAGKAAHMLRNADLMAAPPPPAGLWADLVAQGLLRPDAPVPTS